MPAGPATIVVAGHICLDMIPTFEISGGTLPSLLVPGALVEVGPAVLSTGGAVSNTGLALHRLGVRTRLMGKIGDDLFGEAIRGILRRYDPVLANGLLVAPGEPSSYTVVINPPGVDRVFLHCPGANNTFRAADVPYDELAGVRVFHFGYPPLMRRMYADGGIELATIMQRVKQRGVVTSLDLSRPDATGPAGRVDWRALLARVLPHVDLFLPSLEETVFMLDRARFERLSAGGDLLAQGAGALLSEVANELLAMNAGVVGLKLGDRGLYVRTTGSRERLAALERLCRSSPAPGSTPCRPAALPDHTANAWLGRELLTPCFAVHVVGTTGCGDCTIAGFLAGLVRGLPPEEVMTAAVAVGACNVEQADAVSGVPTWDAVQTRVQAGWQRRPTVLPAADWQWQQTGTMARGPHDLSPIAPRS